MRRQKQLQKRHDTTEDATEKAELAADLRVAAIDVLYPQYYPFLEAYVSLYPQSGKKGEGEESKKGEGEDEDKDEDMGEGKDKVNDTDPSKFFRGPRPPMWDTLKTAFEEGGIAALEAIRDRQPAKEGKKTNKANSKAGSKAAADASGDEPGKKQKEAKKVEEESDSDDGGFFEDT